MCIWLLKIPDHSPVVTKALDWQGGIVCFRILPKFKYFLQRYIFLWENRQSVKTQESFVEKNLEPRISKMVLGGLIGSKRNMC